MGTCGRIEKLTYNRIYAQSKIWMRARATRKSSSQYKRCIQITLDNHETWNVESNFDVRMHFFIMGWKVHRCLVSLSLSQWKVSVKTCVVRSERKGVCKYGPKIYQNHKCKWNLKICLPFSHLLPLFPKGHRHRIVLSLLSHMPSGPQSKRHDSL